MHVLYQQWHNKTVNWTDYHMTISTVTPYLIWHIYDKVFRTQWIDCANVTDDATITCRLSHWVQLKYPPFCGGHFKCICHEWNGSRVDWMVIETGSQRSNWLSINQHWLRKWIGTEHDASNYLNHWWSSLLIYVIQLQWVYQVRFCVIVIFARSTSDPSDGSWQCGAFAANAPYPQR